MVSYGRAGIKHVRREVSEDNCDEDSEDIQAAEDLLMGSVGVEEEMQASDEGQSLPEVSTNAVASKAVKKRKRKKGQVSRAIANTGTVAKKRKTSRRSKIESSSDSEEAFEEDFEEHVSRNSSAGQENEDFEDHYGDCDGQHEGEAQDGVEETCDIQVEEDYFGERVPGNSSDLEADEEFEDQYGNGVNQNDGEAQEAVEEACEDQVEEDFEKE